MGIFQHQLIQWFTNLLHLHLLLSHLQRHLPTGLLGLLMRTLPINLTLANPPPQMSECSLFPRRPPHHYPTSLTPSMLPFLFPLLLHPALHSTLPPSHPWLVELLRRQRGMQPATEHLCVEPATTSSGKITLVQCSPISNNKTSCNMCFYSTTHKPSNFGHFHVPEVD